MVVGRQSVELHLVISGCDQPRAGLRQLVNPVSNVCGILHCLETYVDLCCIVTSTQGSDHQTSTSVRRCISAQVHHCLQAAAASDEAGTQHGGMIKQLDHLRAQLAAAQQDRHELQASRTACLCRWAVAQPGQ